MWTEEWPLPFEMLQALQTLVQEKLNAGTIEESNSLCNFCYKKMNQEIGEC